MSWYAKPWLIFFLYMCPTVMAVCAVFYFALPRQKQYFQFADGRCFHQFVSPILSTNLSQFKQLKKKTNFLLVKKKLKPVEKEITTNFVDSEFEIGEKI